MSTIYVLKEGEKWGPFTTEELEGHVEAGTFAATDMVWSEGMEDWAPLESVVVRVDNDWTTYLDEDGVLITDQWVQLEDKTIPLNTIVKATVQTEKIRRVKPIVGTVVLGVILVCLPFVFLMIHHPGTTLWVIGGLVFLFLLFFWLRLLYSAIRPGRSLIVLDLANGDERILQIDPRIAPSTEEALKRALSDFRSS